MGLQLQPASSSNTDAAAAVHPHHCSLTIPGLHPAGGKRMVQGHRRVLYIEATGWYRPSDGTTYLMGGIDAATYQAQGGVRLVATSLSDHSTLGGVRAFLARMHSEFGVRRRQIRPLTSGLDDVSHLCMWDE